MFVNYEMVLLAGVVAVGLYTLNHWFTLREREFNRSEHKTPNPTPDDSTTMADRKRAILHYRMELMHKENVVIEQRQAEERAINLLEDFTIGESLKLKNAIVAAKQGASSTEICDRYQITEIEAELIVSIHGIQDQLVDNTVH